MAHPSKRKFEPDDDIPDYAVLRGTGRGDDGSRSVPTAETQTLYDELRMIEEGLDMVDRLQYLQPPPHSPAPPSPRSPSCASTTHSLTRAFDDVAIEEEEPQNKKRKAMRRGPLDNVKRARAALMRKLGACAECKARRVGVRGRACCNDAELLADCVSSAITSTVHYSNKRTSDESDENWEPPSALHLERLHHPSHNRASMARQWV
jgi:hypothetical protein